MGSSYSDLYLAIATPSLVNLCNFELVSAAPGPVGDLTAVFDEAGALYNSSARMYFLEVAISWSIPVDPNGIVLGYNYSMQESGGMGFVIPGMNTNLTLVETNVTVVPYTNYTVAVQAFTEGGFGSAERLVVLSPEAGMHDKKWGLDL